MPDTPQDDDCLPPELHWLIHEAVTEAALLCASDAEAVTDAVFNLLGRLGVTIPDPDDDGGGQ